MLDAVTAPKTARKPRGAKAPKAPSFAEVGREAAREAQRRVLLDACEAHDWNLTVVAEVLSMGAGANVIRALRNLAPVEYEAARDAGKISQANRREQ